MITIDHVWNGLKQWEEIWMRELEDELNSAKHEYQEQNVELLKGQLSSIRKALKEIGKWV